MIYKNNRMHHVFRPKDQLGRLDGLVLQSIKKGRTRLAAITEELDQFLRNDFAIRALPEQQRIVQQSLVRIRKAGKVTCHPATHRWAVK